MEFFTRTVEEAPGINTIWHPLHITRLNLDIRFLPDDFHRVYIAPRQVHSGHDPLLPFFRWVLRVVCLASAKRGGANCHAIEENTGLVEEVETLDDITIANPAWVGDIVFTLFAHLVVLCWAL